MNIIQRFLRSIETSIRKTKCERYGHLPPTYIGNNKYICSRCMADLPTKKGYIDYGGQ